MPIRRPLRLAGFPSNPSITARFVRDRSCPEGRRICEGENEREKSSKNDINMLTSQRPVTPILVVVQLDPRLESNRTNAFASSSRAYGHMYVRNHVFCGDRYPPFVSSLPNDCDTFRKVFKNKPTRLMPYGNHPGLLHDTRNLYTLVMEAGMNPSQRNVLSSLKFLL